MFQNQQLKKAPTRSYPSPAGRIKKKWGYTCTKSMIPQIAEAANEAEEAHEEVAAFHTWKRGPKSAR
jgi:hypothetical protein